MDRALKVGGINENFLAMPSISLKICYYPLPTPIFSLILRKSQALSWQKWGGGAIPSIPSMAMSLNEAKTVSDCCSITNQGCTLKDFLHPLPLFLPVNEEFIEYNGAF